MKRSDLVKFIYDNTSPPPYPEKVGCCDWVYSFFKPAPPPNNPNLLDLFRQTLDKINQDHPGDEDVDINSYYAEFYTNWCNTSGIGVHSTHALSFTVEWEMHAKAAYEINNFGVSAGGLRRECDISRI